MSQRTDRIKFIENAYRNVGLVMSSDEKWDTLLDHIETYTKELESEIDYTPSFDEALFCYHENIYVPLMNQLETLRVRLAFRKKSLEDLYLETSEHWFALMKEDKDIYADVAVFDYINQTMKSRVMDFFMKRSNKAYAYYSTKVRFA